MKITNELLARCACNTNRRRNETTSQFIRRLTHLSLNKKGITRIENMAACRHLCVLYLYDNVINRVENLSFATHLTHLYLQNNSISKIEGLRALVHLQKLYLGRNEILILEGLDDLAELEELHIEYQRLPEGEKMLFDPNTISAISNSLLTLNVSGNNIDRLDDFAPLRKLRTLMATSNKVENFSQVELLLTTCRQVSSLDLKDNPISSRPKCRERIIVMSMQLRILDSKNISQTERQDLLNWRARRQQQQQNSTNKYSRNVEVEKPDSKFFFGNQVPQPSKNFQAVIGTSRHQHNQRFNGHSDRRPIIVSKMKTQSSTHEGGSKRFLPQLTENKQLGFSVQRLNLA